MNEANLTTDEMQSFTLDSLTKLLQDSQNPSFDWQNSIIFVIILAAAGFLAKQWFKKTDERAIEANNKIVEVQKTQAVEEYRTKEQDSKLQDLKIKNESVSIRLTEAMTNMANEQANMANERSETFKLLGSIGLTAKQNEFDIKNLKNENKFISKAVRELKLKNKKE